MKKTLTMLGLVALAAAVAAGIALFVLTRPALLANMNGNDTTPTTSSTDISFSAQAGERIKFSFQSNIKSGDLNIVLYDSQGKPVYELAHASELETFFTFEATDTYTLTAHRKDFIGSFRVKVLQPKSIGEALSPGSV